MSLPADVSGLATEFEKPIMARKMQFFVLIIVILIVWILVVGLPTLLYNIRQISQYQMNGDESSAMKKNFTGNIDNSTAVLNCSEGFYSLDGVCRPECGVWQQFSDAAILGSDFVLISAIIVYLIGAAVVVILSLIRYRQMFKYPSVFVVYGTLIGAVYVVFLLIGYFDRNALFCSSRDLQMSVKEPTTFCTVQGVFLYYSSLQLTLFWLCHLMAIFWTVVFPLHAQRFGNNGYFKYVHLGVVIVALTVPWITVAIVLGTGGYVISRFPTILCFPKNVNVAFYAFTLPLVILSATGVTLMVIIFRVLIELVQSQRHLKNKCSLRMALQAHLHIKPVELKVFIIFAYAVLISIISTAATTVGVRNAEELEDDLTGYFKCEAFGTSSGITCPRNFTSALVKIEVLFHLTVLLLAMYPLFNLVYIVNIQELKEFFLRKCGNKLRHDTGTTQSQL